MTGLTKTLHLEVREVCADYRGRPQTWGHWKPVSPDSKGSIDSPHGRTILAGPMTGD